LKFNFGNSGASHMNGGDMTAAFYNYDFNASMSMPMDRRNIGVLLECVSTIDLVKIYVISDEHTAILAGLWHGNFRLLYAVGANNPIQVRKYKIRIAPEKAEAAWIAIGAVSLLAVVIALLLGLFFRPNCEGGNNKKKEDKRRAACNLACEKIQAESRSSNESPPVQFVDNVAYEDFSNTTIPVDCEGKVDFEICNYNEYYESSPCVKI